ncbi:hypothetical protein BH11ARM1_BH11ARM1_04670 [soil metagenome]
MLAGATLATGALAQAWMGFGGNAQHTAQSTIPSLAFDKIVWRAKMDAFPPYNGDELLIHYGSPAITPSNVVVLPVRIGTADKFKVQARSGTDGHIIWSVATNYTFPPHGWFPSFNPTLLPPATVGGDYRVAWPESGGRVAIRASADAATAAKTIVPFYGQATYNLDKNSFNANVKICTPLTAGPDGSIYFGYQVLGANAADLKSGIARIAPNGTGTYAFASDLSGDAGIAEVKQQSAPALSADGNSLYVVVYSGGYGRGKLVQMSVSSMLATHRVDLMDPKSGNTALVDSDGTASPLVGPNGDVFVGVLENPFGGNHLRGWNLHFSGDLSQTYVPGAFGWDNTPSIVPASAVPFYHGSSPYLLFAKYNNYVQGGGDGANHIAILDPFVSATDPVSGIATMNVIAQQLGPKPDTNFVNDGYPMARKEWCVSSAVVDIPGKCILANSEDGFLYRWDLVTNTLSEKIRLTRGIGEAYTCTVMGPDGRVYAVNNAILFGVGSVAR